MMFEMKTSFVYYVKKIVFNCVIILFHWIPNALSRVTFKTASSPLPFHNFIIIICIINYHCIIALEEKWPL